MKMSIHCSLTFAQIIVATDSVLIYIIFIPDIQLPASSPTAADDTRTLLNNRIPFPGVDKPAIPIVSMKKSDQQDSSQPSNTFSLYDMSGSITNESGKNKSKQNIYDLSQFGIRNDEVPTQGSSVSLPASQMNSYKDNLLLEASPTEDTSAKNMKGPILKVISGFKDHRNKPMLRVKGKFIDFTKLKNSTVNNTNNPMSNEKDEQTPTLQGIGLPDVQEKARKELSLVQVKPFVPLLTSTTASPVTSTTTTTVTYEATTPNSPNIDRNEIHAPIDTTYQNFQTTTISSINKDVLLQMEVVANNINSNGNMKGGGPMIVNHLNAADITDDLFSHRITGSVPDGIPPGEKLKIDSLYPDVSQTNGIISESASQVPSNVNPTATIQSGNGQIINRNPSSGQPKTSSAINKTVNGNGDTLGEVNTDILVGIQPSSNNLNGNNNPRNVNPGLTQGTLNNGQVTGNNVRQPNVNSVVNGQNWQGQINSNIPNQGQINPNIQNQGQINPNIQNQGQINPNIQNQWQINQNIQNQGQINPNIQNQGQINPNIQNQGQINPNIQNQGQINPNIPSQFPNFNFPANSRQPQLTSNQILNNGIPVPGVQPNNQGVFQRFPNTNGPNRINNIPNGMRIPQNRFIPGISNNLNIQNRFNRIQNGPNFQNGMRNNQGGTNSLSNGPIRQINTNIQQGQSQGPLNTNFNNGFPNMPVGINNPFRNRNTVNGGLNAAPINQNTMNNLGNGIGNINQFQNTGFGPSQFQNSEPNNFRANGNDIIDPSRQTPTVTGSESIPNTASNNGFNSVQEQPTTNDLSGNQNNINTAGTVTGNNQAVRNLDTNSGKIDTNSVGVQNPSINTQLNTSPTSTPGGLFNSPTQPVMENNFQQNIIGLNTPNGLSNQNLQQLNQQNIRRGPNGQILTPRSTVVQGPNGPILTPGSTVVQGPNGPILTPGSTVVQGPNGPILTPGSTVVQGPNGPILTPGSTVVQGPNGPILTPGSTVVQGPNGPILTPGSTVVQGPNGPILTPGSTVAQGPNGPILTPGSTIVQGPNGQIIGTPMSPAIQGFPFEQITTDINGNTIGRSLNQQILPNSQNPQNFPNLQNPQILPNSQNPQTPPNSQNPQLPPNSQNSQIPNSQNPQILPNSQNPQILPNSQNTLILPNSQNSNIIPNPQNPQNLPNSQNQQILPNLQNPSPNQGSRNFPMNTAQGQTIFPGQIPINPNSQINRITGQNRLQTGQGIISPNTAPNILQNGRMPIPPQNILTGPNFPFDQNLINGQANNFPDLFNPPPGLFQSQFINGPPNNFGQIRQNGIRPFGR